MCPLAYHSLPVNRVSVDSDGDLGTRKGGGGLDCVPACDIGHNRRHWCMASRRSVGSCCLGTTSDV